jgi:hypothetical protein
VIQVFFQSLNIYKENQCDPVLMQSRKSHISSSMGSNADIDRWPLQKRKKNNKIKKNKMERHKGTELIYILHLVQINKYDELRSVIRQFPLLQALMNYQFEKAIIITSNPRQYEKMSRNRGRGMDS